jgi:hypothetical protein
MKTKLVLALVFLTTLFAGCKNEKSVDDLDLVTPTVVDNYFKVTLNVNVKKDDNFSLFFTEDGTIDFKGNPIWVKVKGSDIAQDVVFNLPADRLPSQLRLDFGMAKDQESIKINTFKMQYLEKSFEITGDKFYIYFNPDISKTIFDKTAATVSAIKKDGINTFPSFYPNTAPLKIEIDKLVK